MIDEPVAFGIERGIGDLRGRAFDRGPHTRGVELGKLVEQRTDEHLDRAKTSGMSPHVEVLDPRCAAGRYGPRGVPKRQLRPVAPAVRAVSSRRPRTRALATRVWVRRSSVDRRIEHVRRRHLHDRPVIHHPAVQSISRRDPARAAALRVGVRAEVEGLNDRDGARSPDDPPPGCAIYRLDSAYICSNHAASNAVNARRTRPAGSRAPSRNSVSSSDGVMSGAGTRMSSDPGWR